MANVLFTFRTTTELRDAFLAYAEAHNTDGSTLLREYMQSLVWVQQQKPSILKTAKTPKVITMGEKIIETPQDKKSKKEKKEKKKKKKSK